MGLDCTLHLVDERALRDVFAPTLLEQRDGPTPLDACRPDDADALWTQARSSLRDEQEEPLSVCMLVGQLALLFSAGALPYVHQDGFALSLWPEFPRDLAGSPGQLFPDLLAAHPRLRGHFPEAFVDGFGTGVYLPAASVPRALAFARQAARGATGADLALVLAAAAARGLGYWEGVDLDLPHDRTPYEPRRDLRGALRELAGGAPR